MRGQLQQAFVSPSLASSLRGPPGPVATVKQQLHLINEFNEFDVAAVAGPIKQSLFSSFLIGSTAQLGKQHTTCNTIIEY